MLAVTLQGAVAIAVVLSIPAMLVLSSWDRRQLARRRAMPLGVQLAVMNARIRWLERLHGK